MSLVVSCSFPPMSGQKPLHFLRSTRFWSMVQTFLDDPESEVLELPRSLTAAERDQVRQICKHFDTPFKVLGEGVEKYMVIRKPDYSHFEVAEEMAPLSVFSKELDQLRSLCVELAKRASLETFKTKILLEKLGSDVNSSNSLFDKISLSDHWVCSSNCGSPPAGLTIASGRLVCAACSERETLIPIPPQDSLKGESPSSKRFRG